MTKETQGVVFGEVLLIMMVIYINAENLAPVIQEMSRRLGNVYPECLREPE